MAINRRQLASVARSAIISLLLLAMLISVASAGQAKSDPVPASSSKPTVESVCTEQLMPGPPAPDDASGKMAPVKKRPVDSSPMLASPVVPKSDTDKARIIPQNAEPCAFGVFIAPRPHHTRLPYSVAMVSPLVGRQFTLVGARPSGTM